MKSELDIEETQRVIRYGLVCFVENGKRFYYKPKKLSDAERKREKTAFSEPLYELIPLTLAEKVKYKLGIEESELEQQDEREIEESAQDDSVEEKMEKLREEEKKKTHKVDMNDPDSVKNAKDILDKQLKKLEEPAKTEELQEENEHLKTTLQLIAEKEFERKKKSENCQDPSITTPEQLEAWSKGKRGSSGVASGSAPLNPDYFENTPIYDNKGELKNKKYPSYEAMIQDLHDRQYVFQDSPKGLEAKRMLDAITRKFFEEHKNTNSPVPILQKPLPKLIEVNGLVIPEDPNFGDLQERNRIFRRRKILEREERGSVTVKGEEQK